jgi:hypothetical protein
MMSLLRAHIFPALTLTGSNSHLAYEAWQVLRPLPWSARFELYTHLKDAAHEAHPVLAFARNRASAATRQAMKRVAAETLRQSGRMLGKWSASNPFSVMEILITTLETYDNLIPLATEAIKYAGPLALDAVAFTLVDRLWLDRPRTKGDGMTPADWLSSLAAFTGVFYRRYFHVEIGALLNRIVCGLTGLGGTNGYGDNGMLGSGSSSSSSSSSSLDAPPLPAAAAAPPSLSLSRCELLLPSGSSSSESSSELLLTSVGVWQWGGTGGEGEYMAFEPVGLEGEGSKSLPP